MAPHSSQAFTLHMSTASQSAAQRDTAWPSNAYQMCAVHALQSVGSAGASARPRAKKG